MNEYELVAAAKAGDQQAFQSLINMARPRLERTVRYYVKNDFDMHDIVQDAIVKAFISIETLKEEKYFFTWLTKISIYCALDFLQKQKRIVPVEEVMLGGQATIIDEMDRSLIVSEAISTLPLKQKQVIILKYLKGLKLREIAQMLDRPLGTVKTDLHKGLKQLRKELCEQSDSNRFIEEELHTMKDELKRRAQEIVEIPSHFHLEIEDYSKNDRAEEAFFSWTDRSNNDGILITLDQKGNLISLTYDLDEAYLEQEPRSLAEKKELAEQFFCDHYPNALELFTLVETKEMQHWTRFEYGQMMLELPLPQTGGFIDVSRSGVIVQFQYYGEKKLPHPPKTLRSKDELFEKMRQMNEFDLMITRLYKGIYECGNDELRLVYRVGNSFQTFQADDEKQEFVHEYDESEEQYKAVPAVSFDGNHVIASIEDLIGITANMVKIREKEMDDEFGIVWRDAEFADQEYDKSLNGFFMKQTEETVKARVDKENGRLKGFWWFKDRMGDLQLTREQCYEKALEFLQKIYPDLARFIEVRVCDSSEEDEPNDHEAFHFRIHNGAGVLFETGYIIVSVNRTTGLIDMFSGLDLELTELMAVPSQPILSKSEAEERFFASLDFKLEWEVDYDSENEAFKLVYKPFHQGKKLCARYVDALSGELIFGKE